MRNDNFGAKIMLHKVKTLQSIPDNVMASFMSFQNDQDGVLQSNMQGERGGVGGNAALLDDLEGSESMLTRINQELKYMPSQIPLRGSINPSIIGSFFDKAG